MLLQNLSMRMSEKTKNELPAQTTQSLHSADALANIAPALSSLRTLSDRRGESDIEQTFARCDVIIGDAWTSDDVPS